MLELAGLWGRTPKVSATLAMLKGPLDRRSASHLAGAHFDDDEIIELTALVTFQNMSRKFPE